MNYPLLKTTLEAPDLVGQSDAQILETLNAPSIEYHETVPTSHAANVLLTTFSTLPSPAPLTLHNRLSLAFRDLSKPDYIRAYAESVIDLVTGQIQFLALDGQNYVQMAGALVAANVWSQEDADLVLNLGKRFKSRAETEFGGEVSELDIARARLCDKVAQARALYETHRGLADAAEQAALSLENGIDVDLDAL